LRGSKLKQLTKISLVLRLLIVSILFIFALSFLDYNVFHLSEDYPFALYRYWFALTLVFICFGFGLAYGIWIGKNQNSVPDTTILATFLTVIFLYIAGVLDLFYYSFTVKYSEPYSFEYWSAQWRWFGYWDMKLQLLWSSFWIGMIFVVWWLLVFRKQITRLRRR